MRPNIKTTVRAYLIPRDLAPAGPPIPLETIEITAPTTDGLLTAARAALETDGRRLRSLSFGPGDLIAYVEEVR